MQSKGTAKSKSTESGTAFEQRVAALYRRLGFKVIHNVNLNSSQTDLICSKEAAGVPPNKIYVECKHRYKEAVTKPEVALFLSTYDQLRLTHRLTSGVMITDSTFSPDARDFASLRPDVRLLTEDELNDELLNINAQLGKYVQFYEQQDIFSSYISLKTTAGNDLASWCEDWIGGNTRINALLGDFGVGKTTFLKHLQYSFAKRYLARQSRRVPVYFLLRDFGRYPDLQSFVESQIMREFGDSDYDTFGWLLESGRLLLLLDGFDEMASQVDSTRRKELFAALAPLCPYGSKAILTCRPGYFVTDSEMRDILRSDQGFVGKDISLLSQPTTPEIQSRRKPLARFRQASQDWIPADAEIHPISPADITYAVIELLEYDDIEQYLKNRAAKIEEGGKTWEWVWDKIVKTYNLKDLARRPILLNLMVSTLPKLEHSVEPSPAVIYDSYTAAWLNHDYAKGAVRWLIKKPDKLLFMTELAFAMYSAGTLRLHYLELPAAIKEYFGVTRSVDLQYFATDIQTCSFLRRDDGGEFEFIHKSFAEFFTAVYLKEQLKAGNHKCLARTRLSPEILFFLGDLAHIEEGVKKRLQSLATGRGQGAAVLKENVLGALGCSQSSIASKQWTELTIERLHFVNCDLSVVEFAATKTKEIYFDRCALEDVRVSADEGRIVLNATHCSDITLSTLVAGADAGPGILVRGGRVENGKLEGRRTTVRLEDSTHFVKCVVTGGDRWRLDKDDRGCTSLFEADGAIMESTVVSNCRIGSVRALKAEGCWFLGVYLPRNLPPPAFLRARGSLCFSSGDDRDRVLEWSRQYLKTLRQRTRSKDDRRARVEAEVSLLKDDDLVKLIFGLGFVPSIPPQNVADVQREITDRLLIRLDEIRRAAKADRWSSAARNK